MAEKYGLLALLLLKDLQSTLSKFECTVECPLYLVGKEWEKMQLL